MHQPRSTMNTAAVGAPLRHPAFQRLWLGLSISYLGDQFTIIALLWFVLQLTGSGAAVGPRHPMGTSPTVQIPELNTPQ